MEGAITIGSVKGILPFVAERRGWRCSRPEHAACQYIGSVDRHQRLSRDFEIGSAPHETVYLAQSSTVQRIADGAGVREVRLGLAGGDVAGERVPSSFAESVVLFGKDQFTDLQQLVLPIIRKIDVMSDARTKSRIARKKALHTICITGEDDHEVFPLVLH